MMVDFAAPFSYPTGGLRVTFFPDTGGLRVTFFRSFDPTFLLQKAISPSHRSYAKELCLQDILKQRDITGFARCFLKKIRTKRDDSRRAAGAARHCTRVRGLAFAIRERSSGAAERGVRLWQAIIITPRWRWRCRRSPRWTSSFRRRSALGSPSLAVRSAMPRRRSRPFLAA